MSEDRQAEVDASDALVTMGELAQLKKVHKIVLPREQDGEQAGESPCKKLAANSKTLD